MTTSKKTASKKLSVKDLANLKAGMMSAGTELSAEVSDGTKTIKADNQKTGASAATATLSGTSVSRGSIG